MSLKKKLLVTLVVAGLAPATAFASKKGTKKPEPRVIELTVTKKGFEPSPVQVKKGEPLTLVVTRKVQKTCATEIVVPGYDVKADLPLDTPVKVSFTPTKTGQLKYGCAMDQMIGGVLSIE